MESAFGDFTPITVQAKTTPRDTALEKFDKLSARCEELHKDCTEKYSAWCLAADALKRAEAARREAFLSAINL